MHATKHLSTCDQCPLRKVRCLSEEQTLGPEAKPSNGAAEGNELDRSCDVRLHVGIWWQCKPTLVSGRSAGSSVIITLSACSN